MYVLFDDVSIERLDALKASTASIKEAAKLAGKLAQATGEYGERIARINEIYKSPSLGRSAKGYLKCSEKLVALHTRFVQAVETELAATVEVITQDFLRIEQWVRESYAAKWQGGPRAPAMSAATKRATRALLDAITFADLIEDLQQVNDPVDNLGDLEDSSFVMRAQRLSEQCSELTSDLELAVEVSDDPAAFVSGLAAEWDETIAALQGWGSEDFEEEDDDDEDDEEEDDDEEEA